MIFRFSALLGLVLALHGQDTWPTFNGDYSGRRFSPLTQINAKNVGNLALAWVYRADSGPASNPFGVQIKATPLLINGVLYFTMPDHAWAIDARTGRQLWHFEWKSTGGIHIGNRGVGIYRDWLFFETPDDFLVSLDRNTGKMRWSVQIADVKQQYFATPAPLIIGNHVIVEWAGIRSMCPDSLNRMIPRQANSNGNGIARRSQAPRGRNRGPTRMPWATAVE